MTNNLTKNLNKTKHLNLLITNNIDWTWKDESIGHVELNIKGTKISFWLSSGKWYIQSLNQKGTGFYQLLDFLELLNSLDQKPQEPKEDKDQIIAELRHQVSVLSEALAKYEDKPIEEYFV